MENGSQLLLVVAGLLCSGFVGAGSCVALAIALTVGYRNMDGRLKELEKRLELKPNSRAAVERRDAYEEALFAVANARQDVAVANERLEVLTTILSRKAEGK